MISHLCEHFNYIKTDNKLAVSVTHCAENTGIILTARLTLKMEFFRVNYSLTIGNFQSKLKWKYFNRKKTLLELPVK